MGLVIKDNIAVDIEAKDWKEAIKVAGDLLVKSGHITEDYVHAMIDTVITFGAYIVICPGVALAHARPEAGVISPGLSLAILRNPVEFGHESNDPVKLVFALASIDHSCHIDALSVLSDIISDESKMESLFVASNASQVMEILC